MYVPRRWSWESQGYRNFGRAPETSCFPAIDAGTAGEPHVLWPLALYPVSGTAEVVFQHLKTRPPSTTPSSAAN
ncbi:MAG TPA: hypothetical protein VLH10_12390 [Yinghuangia sp.]|nr:hypothetical protein [Yinghuangia sp.]